VAYLGLDPKVRQSGEAPARSGRISNIIKQYERAVAFNLGKAWEFAAWTRADLRRAVRPAHPARVVARSLTVGFPLLFVAVAVVLGGWGTCV
jgi:transposase